MRRMTTTDAQASLLIAKRESQEIAVSVVDLLMDARIVLPSEIATLVDRYKAKLVEARSWQDQVKIRLERGPW